MTHNVKKIKRRFNAFYFQLCKVREKKQESQVFYR